MNVYLLIAVGSAALAVGAGIWDGYRLRTNARYSPLVLWITAGGPVVSLVLFLLVGGLGLKLPVTLGLLALGTTIGVLVAQRARLSVVVPCEDEPGGDPAEPCADEADATAGPKGGGPKGGRSKEPQVRLVGASWMPVPAAFAVAALQVAVALELVTWEILALAALEAAAAFGVASAAVLVRRRSRFGRGLDGSDREAVEASSGTSGEAAAAQG
jgi:hypothetical protein